MKWNELRSYHYLYFVHHRILVFISLFSFNRIYDFYLYFVIIHSISSTHILVNFTSCYNFLSKDLLQEELTYLWLLICFVRSTSFILYGLSLSSWLISGPIIRIYQTNIRPLLFFVSIYLDINTAERKMLK